MKKMRILILGKNKIILQKQKEDNSWVNESEYYILDGMIPTMILADIEGLITFGYCYIGLTYHNT